MSPPPHPVRLHSLRRSVERVRSSERDRCRACTGFALANPETRAEFTGRMARIKDVGRRWNGRPRLYRNVCRTVRDEYGEECTRVGIARKRGENAAEARKSLYIGSPWRAVTRYFVNIRQGFYDSSHTRRSSFFFSSHCSRQRCFSLQSRSLPSSSPYSRVDA